MQTVGEKLKEARLKKDISLDEVYRQTKIHPHVLEALEQDRADIFLSAIYIKGFLKTYAQYLGLNTEQLLKEYIDGRKAQAPAASSSETALEKRRKSYRALEPSRILRVIAVVILGVVFVFYFRLLFQHIFHTYGKKADRPRVKVEVVPATPLNQAEELILEVRTLDDCWMRVVADRQVIFEKTLPKDKRERWQAKEKLELRIGKPEALEVSVNGKVVDLKKAQFKKGLVITREGITGR